MSVIFRCVWHVVVDDMADAGHVYASGGNVGGHQNIEPSAFEILQDPASIILGHISLQIPGPKSG